jgi:phosphoglycolate phosphatase
MKIFDGVKAVLFDLDGTLIETNIDFNLMRREVISFAEKYGIPASRLENLDILSMVEVICADISALEGYKKSETVRKEVLAILERIELAHSLNASPIPHAHELLKTLRNAGIKVGIITRNCRSAVAISLAKTGISGDVVLTRDDVRKTKPHPSHFLQALEILKVPPENAVIIGDHWMDIQGGKAAGIRTIGFLRPDRSSDFFSQEHPDLVIKSLGELTHHVFRSKE